MAGVLLAIGHSATASELKAESLAPAAYVEHPRDDGINVHLDCAIDQLRSQLISECTHFVVDVEIAHDCDSRTRRRGSVEF